MPFLLMIRERRNSWAGRGPIAIIHPSEEAAHADLLDHVRKNWDDEMNVDPPEDDGDGLIEMYFDQVPEEYVITEVAYSTSPANAET